jgi:hypothetical protein
MISLSLKQMTQAKKLMAFEALWEDLSQNEQTFEPPTWHQEELAATEERVNAGKEQFVDWEQAKKELRK